MITTINAPDIIKSARSLLMKARRAKQVMQMHQDWLDRNPNSPAAKEVIERIVEEKHEARNCRTRVRALLRYEEKLAGREFCEIGITRGGAKHLQGFRFWDWKEHRDTFDLSSEMDVWL